MYKTQDNKLFETNIYINKRKTKDEENWQRGLEAVYVELSDDDVRFVTENGKEVKPDDFLWDDGFEVYMDIPVKEISETDKQILNQLGFAIQERHGLISGYCGVTVFPGGDELYGWGFYKMNGWFIPSKTELHQLLWSADAIWNILKMKGENQNKACKI